MKLLLAIAIALLRNWKLRNLSVTTSPGAGPAQDATARLFHHRDTETKLMGVATNVGFSEFPRQGNMLGRRVNVCSRYDPTKTINGVCVRDDMVEPFRTIFRLDDGRYVLASECQYSYDPGAANAAGQA